MTNEKSAVVTESMSREDLVAIILAMQDAMKEQSKALTFLKNSILEEKKAKAQAKAAAKEKKPKAVKHVKVEDEDLEVIMLEIEHQRTQCGTWWAQSVYAPIRKMWAEYMDAHKDANIQYLLSQLWVRIRRLGITGTYNTFRDFSEFMVAPAAA